MLEHVKDVLASVRFYNDLFLPASMLILGFISVMPYLMKKHTSRSDGKIFGTFLWCASALGLLFAILYVQGNTDINQSFVYLLWGSKTALTKPWATNVIQVVRFARFVCYLSSVGVFILVPHHALGYISKREKARQLEFELAQPGMQSAINYRSVNPRGEAPEQKKA